MAVRDRVIANIPVLTGYWLHVNVVTVVITGEFPSYPPGRLSPAFFLKDSSLCQKRSSTSHNVASHGTADMIFTARQLQEKCKKQKQSLYMAFIDLTKAFDSVNRQALWTILSRCGCSEKSVRILRLLHHMSAAVFCSGSKTEPFKVETGVKQGCIIAPTLFTVFIAAILHLIGNNLPTGVQFVFRTDGKLFNLNRLKAKSKLSHSSIMELQYADDNAIATHTEEDLQARLNAFTTSFLDPEHQKDQGPAPAPTRHLRTSANNKNCK